MSTRLRQRTSWEAIDLGYCLGQQWFWPLWLLWMLPAALVLMVTLALFDSNILALLVTWWLQPLYERPLLHFLSRALFGEYPPLKKEFRNYWRIAFPQILRLISWRRFNPARSFVEPVTMLEGLKGKARQRRINVLSSGLNGTAAWFSVLCLCFDLVLIASQLFLLQLFIPQEWTVSVFDVLSDPDQRLHWLGCVVWLIAASVTAPFFVAGGFTLYISRRTQLEGWDIELEFRKIVSRLHQKQNSIVSAVLLSLVISLATLSPTPASADIGVAANKTEARELIKEISARPEFGEEKTRTVWRKIKQNDKKKDSKSGNWFIDSFNKMRSWFGWMAEVVPLLATFLKAILVLGIIGFLVWLLRRYTGWLDWLSFATRPVKRRQQIPASLFGLELSTESLPDDVTKTALALLEQKEIRAALSLLFRATLSHLIHQKELPISGSTTEGECIRLVEDRRPLAEVHYFRTLIRCWQLLAYAHQPPPTESVRNLCQQWSQFYQPLPVAEGDQ